MDTKNHRVGGAKKQALLEAINQVKRLEISYQQTGKKSRRFIVPKNVPVTSFTLSQHAGF